VTTPDGRKIQLYDNMTFRVLGAAPSSQSALIEVRIKAEVITKAGEVKPVARTQFKVFSGDIRLALSTINDREGKPMDIFNFYIYRRALEKLKPAMLATFTTDSEGNGRVQVPRSDKSYYLYGRLSVESSACVWYIEFKPNENVRFLLDNNNWTLCR
jgi:hypothetical protein